MSLCCIMRCRTGGACFTVNTDIAFSKFSPPDSNPSQRIKPGSWIRNFFGSKLLRLYAHYDDALQRFPRLYKVYRIFADGTRDLYSDFVLLTKLSIDLATGRQVKDFKFKELLVYYETPKNLIRVSPTILISILPFANYVMFPLAYRFPRYLLSSHYWTPEQRTTFMWEDHVSRMRYYTAVYHRLREKHSLICDEEHRMHFHQIFRLLGSGHHPSVAQLVHLKSYFSSSQLYGLPNLPSNHLADLCRLHSVTSSLLPTGRVSRLETRAEFLWEMDRAIERESGPGTLDPSDLQKVCFDRGLNPIGLTQSELMHWLNQWLSVSASCDGATFSLLLHCPLFLAYNHPNNRRF